MKGVKNVGSMQKTDTIVSIISHNITGSFSENCSEDMAGNIIKSA